MAERTRVGAHVQMRDKADSTVLAVPNAKIARESELKFESMEHFDMTPKEIFLGRILNVKKPVLKPNTSSFAIVHGEG